MISADAATSKQETSENTTIALSPTEDEIRGEEELMNRIDNLRSEVRLRPS